MATLASEILRTSFLGKIPLLTKATSDDAESTPGHLIYEINKLTYDGETQCHDIILWLNGRLKLNSPNVKLKTLKLQRHLVDKGHFNFKKILRNKSNEIAEACKFGGIMKSLDESLKCSQVRKEANELLEFLYSFRDHEEDENTRLPPAMTGMGSSSSSNLMGFGNSIRTKDSLSETFIKGVSGIAGKLSDLNFSSKVDFYTTNDTQLMSIDANSDISCQPCCTTSHSTNDDNGVDLEKRSVCQFVQDSSKSIFKATQSLIKTCQRLDKSKLLKLLQEDLQQSDNKDTIKYLIAIEALQENGLVNSEDLHGNFSEILCNFSSNDANPRVKFKSKKILLTLKYFLPNHQRDQMALEQG